MKNKKVIAILIIAGLLVVGVFFGISKAADAVQDDLTGNTEQDPIELTWYAAKLPGAEQVYFYTFNGGEVNTPGIELIGEFYNNNGHLEVKDYGDVYLHNITDTTLTDHVAADVVVYDFDIWHPTGTPDTTFDSGLVKFSNRYYVNFGESGGVGDPINAFCITCENFPGDGNFEACVCVLGEDFSGKVHVTVLAFSDKTVYYINGCYLYEEQFNFEGFGLNLSSLAFDPEITDGTSIEHGTIAIDNIECVVFGNGTGSYNGILMDYRTNTSLKISDLMEVN